MSDLPAPPLGDEIPDSAQRTCTRLLGRNGDGTERLCGAPAVVHVDWGDALGFICADHAGDLGERWSVRAGHDIGSACGMPGSLWYDAVWESGPESWCAMPGDGSDVAEPTRAVASEVAT